MTAALGMLLSGGAFGYYFFVHYPGPTGPYPVIPEKFDLTTLPSNTLSFYIEQSGPGTIAPGDSFQAIVSQIKLAAQVWNTVPTSTIKLSFGGLISAGDSISLGPTQVSPGVDVAFDSDIPPGLRAMTTITKWDYTGVTSASFIPILRSRISLRLDQTQYPDPTQPGGIVQTVTYDEYFFTTVVHEFGHSLGLQHSLTSGAMAQLTTRGTTKSHPLTPDDVAGVSILYPTADFATSTGSITGQVTATDGTGINMASVVVISANGPAISNLTNPDGTYQISGIPPGIYYVYVHPLPSADAVDSTPDNILQPWASLTSRNGQITTRDVFGLVFQPQTYTITAGLTTGNVNFTVQRKSTIPISDVTTYSYVGSNAVKASPLPTGQTGQLVAAGNGIVSSSGLPLSGLTVTVLGGSAATILPWDNPYLILDFSPPYGAGPRHMIFSGGGDQYVLPYAFNMMYLPPPNITAVTSTTDSNGNPAAMVQGTTLLSDTRILFDGVVAPTLANNPDGSMLVSLPSAPGSYQSRVVALNSDGQSSIFVQGNNVIQYNYATGSSGAFGMSMASLPAGQEAMIEINGTGTNFVAGQVLAGFGSSDIVAQQVFVVSPTQILVNVAIQSQAPPVAATVTVTSGLQLMSQSVAFQILPPTLNALVVSPILVNANTGLDGVSAGSMANVSVANLGGAGTTAAVLVNGQPTTTQSLGNGVLQFQVPTSLTPGPAVLTIQLGNGVVSYPVAFNVDLPPPVIDDALAGTSGELDSSYPAQPGQLITLIVEGIQSGTTLPITVTIGGQSQTPLSVLPSGDGVTTQVQLLVPGVVMTGSQVPVTITVGTRVSAPFNIPIASN